MESEEEILQEMAMMNRQSREQKTHLAALSEEEQQCGAAIAAYEPSSGLMQLTDANGSKFCASAITNGAIGKGESVRIRNSSTYASYDGMPRRVIATTPQIATLVQKIIVGHLVQVFAPVAEETNPFYYVIGYFLGVLDSTGNATQTLLINENIPAASFAYYPTQLLRNSYDSMHYSGNTLLYIDSSAVSVSTASEDIANLICYIYSLSINSSNLKQSIFVRNQISLANQTPIYSLGSPRTILYAYDQACFQATIKYKSEDSSIGYTVVSGVVEENTTQNKGIIIWDIRNYAEVTEINNPACYFGFNWSLSFYLGLFFQGAYGAIGGIVLHLRDTSLSASAQNFDVFVPEALIQGQQAREVLPQDLIFSIHVNIIISPSSSPSVITVGQMPPPLETRQVSYPKVKGIQSNQELILYSLFDTDKGKELLSP